MLALEAPGGYPCHRAVHAHDAEHLEGLEAVDDRLLTSGLAQAVTHMHPVAFLVLAPLALAVIDDIAHSFIVELVHVQYAQQTDAAQQLVAAVQVVLVARLGTGMLAKVVVVLGQTWLNLL